MQDISENIRKIRVAQGYSQEFIAKKLGVSQQTYSQLERNAEEASLRKLKELAKILNVEFLTLINGEEKFIQTKLNQQGGHTATKMVFNNTQDDYISHLKSEIDQLRKEINVLIEKL
jgi:transcriptional regulator with XRE-family HTH domain